MDKTDSLDEKKILNPILSFQSKFISQLQKYQKNQSEKTSKKDNSEEITREDIIPEIKEEQTSAKKLDAMPKIDINSESSS